MIIPDYNLYRYLALILCINPTSLFESLHRRNATQTPVLLVLTLAFTILAVYCKLLENFIAKVRLLDS